MNLRIRIWDSKTRRMYCPVEVPEDRMMPEVNSGRLYTAKDYSADQIVVGSEKSMLEISWNEGGLGIRAKHGMMTMLSSGLRDEHGAEIFEGDILLHGKATAMVLLKNGMFCMSDMDTCPLVDLWPDKGARVIGNIYENPEMIKAETDDG